MYWYYLGCPMVAFIAFSGSIYMFHDFEKPSIWIAIHATLIKNGYGIAFSIFLLGFLNNMGGIVREVFHHHIWVVLSRLTFGVFLNHIIVMRYLEGTKHTVSYASILGVVTSLIYTEFIAIALAVVTCISIEFPFTNIFSVILNKNKSSISVEDKKNKNNIVMNANLLVN